MYSGVDTHKKTHGLVGIDDQGHTCGTRSVAKSLGGCLKNLAGVAPDRDASPMAS